jgi:hypothetical protein
MADNDSSSFTQSFEFPVWQPLYQAALLETNPEQLHHRVLRAEEAIFNRSQELLNSSNGEAERHAMDDAMRALRVIQVEKLNYPEWGVKR